MDNKDHLKMDRNRQEIDARFALIETRIAHPVSNKQRNEIEKRIGQSIVLGTVLYAFPLTNADEPEIGFVPYRGTDR